MCLALPVSAGNLPGDRLYCFSWGSPNKLIFYIWSGFRKTDILVPVKVLLNQM